MISHAQLLELYDEQLRTDAETPGAIAVTRLGHSDSTEYSRPILERSGLVKVSTTTP